MNDPFASTPEKGGTEEPPATERERLLADAVAEFIDICSRGEAPDLESFLNRYADLQPELAVELRTISGIDQIMDGAPGFEPQHSAEEKIPETLSGYKIIKRLGAGGMGDVFLAMDERLGRMVAIKTLGAAYLHDQQVRSRFMLEARALASLSHPNIARIYSLGQPDEVPHFVMEYIEGVNLIEAAHDLSVEKKVELFCRVVRAVEFLHRHQTIHRDLKPGNILVGPEHEPKLLDFGLARQLKEAGRLTFAGQVMGTPDYFSPEQARADESLDERSDIFSLGIILFEMLTGEVPFHAVNYSEQIRMIVEQEPELPRRLNTAIPGDLQHVCLRCLEKTPGDRYRTAHELAEDLERFLAGEPVLASPKSYARLMSGKIEQHLRDLRGWFDDSILSVYELDEFSKLYGRLVEREDSWILEMRRLSLSQVSLYLGAWITAVAAALVLLFRYPGLQGTPAVLLVAAASIPMAAIGLRFWRQGRLRIAIAYLLAFCLLCPTLLLIAMKEWRILTHFSRGKQTLELFAGFSDPEGAASFSGTTNAQLWWAMLLSLPVYLWLRKLTRSSVFSLVLAVACALLCTTTLLRMGMIEWLQSDPGQLYFRLIPVAALFFVLASGIERLRLTDDSRYFYPIAVGFTFVALSGVAGWHKPYADGLNRLFPWTREQIEYLFIINAGVYLVIQSLSEKFGSAQMRWVAKSFRFVIPGHILTSLLLLGLAATARWDDALGDASLRHEARLFEIVLPVAACLFVLGSVPKQMKNFFVTGLLFLAVGITRLQMDLFKERMSWPISLLMVGMGLMIIAANYTPIKLRVTRWFRR